MSADGPGKAIAWIDQPGPKGSWGSPDDLAIPISDRALLLADGIFETLLVEAGVSCRLEEHLARWQRGAHLLAMAEPPAKGQVQKLIGEAVSRSGITGGALRLNWSRASGGPSGGPSGAGRGLDLPSEQSGRFWLQLNPYRPNFAPVRLFVSPTESRSATSLLSCCKTMAYGAAIQARRQAVAAGFDDALLPCSGGPHPGELSCGTSANLLVLSSSGWITPPLASGCLPGVMRGLALQLGLAKEKVIGAADLHASAGALLINSLGCRPISQLGDQPLPIAPEPEALWRQLLAAPGITT
ncbi:aminotransferase class IV [Cyanobium sp. WAJ14-Wanaka]|uniref:aminotransferase class IV n=1 Tax=Cyanobium sp. WAJ14-Wanaka TaxID=2823725 RepID=UPI0020CC4908|nr:aminotransferase class IV [Cyanobium sp. WAJ14-Wanaka]MCP9775491.1 aminotransferase class IV [Cyanobium sp. WAJ14-Wanaka]